MLEFRPARMHPENGSEVDTYMCLYGTREGWNRDKEDASETLTCSCHSRATIEEALQVFGKRIVDLPS